MVMKPVTWLHLSDFHFQSDGDSFSQDQAARALLDSVRSELDTEGFTPSFAVVTGDVAFSGRMSEYSLARSFFEGVATTTGIPPAGFFFVPGNHDVNRDHGELAFHGGRQMINSPEKVDYYLAQQPRIAPLVQRQEAFWTFVRDFAADQERHPTPDGLGYVARFELDGLIIGLLGLNSAWLSGTDGEEMRLVVGERQMINAIEAAKEMAPHFMVAMAHHPVSWLAEWDASSCRTRLLPAVDLYLRGHLHTGDVALASSPLSPCIEIAAGSGHATRFYQNSYNIITLDPRAAECVTTKYTYDPDRAHFDRSDPVRAPLTVRGDVPGGRAALAEAIREVGPESARFADFMAGLLTNDLDEVPLLVGGLAEFVVPAAARNFTSGEPLTRMHDFLGLRNLLRLRGGEASIDSLIADHAGEIRAYGASLQEVVLADPSCAARLSRESPSVRAGGASPSERWSVALLNELKDAEDWPQLAIEARRLAASPDLAMRRLARSRLAEALIHSDEAQKRAEAYDLATELASDNSASDPDIILAAAAAEVKGDDEVAIRILREAFDVGRKSAELVTFALGVAARVGDRELREVAERVSSAPTGESLG